MPSSAVPTANKTEPEAVAGVIAVLKFAIDHGKYRTLRQLRAQYRDIARDMKRWLRMTNVPIRQPCTWPTFRQYLPESVEFGGGINLGEARGKMIAKYGIAQRDSNGN